MKKIIITLLIIALIIVATIFAIPEINRYYTVEGTIVGIKGDTIYIGTNGKKRRAK